MDHNHDYPHPQVQHDDLKRKESQAPEEEPKELNPPRTPFPDVPPPALRTSSPARNLPPPALQCPGQAEHCQNVLCPPMVNLPQHPQCDCRAPLCPGNVYGECQHPINQLWDIKVSPDGDKQLVRPLGPNKWTHWTIFLVVSPTPLQRPVRKMCKEGGANLVHFLMGKALTTQDPQTKNIRNRSYKDIAHLPQAEQNSGDLLAKKSLMCCISATCAAH